jgi:hypothetical protein
MIGQAEMPRWPQSVGGLSGGKAVLKGTGCPLLPQEEGVGGGQESTMNDYPNESL